MKAKKYLAHLLKGAFCLMMQFLEMGTKRTSLESHALCTITLTTIISHL